MATFSCAGTRRIGLRSLCALCAAPICAVMIAQAPSSNAAQSPQLIPRSREQRDQLFRAEHHAILNVKVTDASGMPLSGLAQSDFKLIDNSQPRTLAPIRFVEHGTPSASPHVVLLLDVLNQSSREFAEDTDGVRKFLSRSSGALNAPTAIAVLSSSGLAVGEASRDPGAVMQRLDAMTRGVKATRCADLTDAPVLYSGTWTDRSAVRTIGDQAPICLNQKFIMSVTNLEHLAVKEVDTPGRLILIWIGPGWPQLNGKQFLPDTPQIKENFFEHLVLLLTAMREGQVTVDNISPPRPRQMPKDQVPSFFDGVPKAENMTSENLSLVTLAHQSGGQIQNDSQGIPDAIAKCMKDAEFFYVLSFDFLAPSLPHEFHSLQVEVNRPQATIRTNTVYYADP